MKKIQQKGVKVGYSTVRDYLILIKKKDKIFMRIHTLPAEEGQVDFGEVGYTPYRGKRRRTWVFNLRLSYFCLGYDEGVYYQWVETFILCHIHTFRFFGGMPQRIKIDNLKSVVLEANFYKLVYQKLYRNFASY